MRVRPRSSGSVGAVISALLWVASRAQAADEDPLAALVRERGWVVAGLESAGALDRIVVKGREGSRVVYEPRPEDLKVNGPVLSPDGSRLAFYKEEWAGGRAVERLYVMMSDGSQRRVILEFDYHSPFLIQAHGGPSQVSWSPDNRQIAFVERVEGEDGRRLKVVEVETGVVRPLAGPLGTRMLGRYGPGPQILSMQAWAPDSRRLVYSDSQARIKQLDTVTLEVSDVGGGALATWSPDGRVLAVRRYSIPHPRMVTEFELVGVGKPGQRQRLAVSARLRLFVSSDATWTPDSRMLIVTVLRSEYVEHHVVDVSTGKGSRTRLFGARPVMDVRSIAGKP